MYGMDVYNYYFSHAKVLNFQTEQKVQLFMICDKSVCFGAIKKWLLYQIGDIDFCLDKR